MVYMLWKVLVKQAVTMAQVLWTFFRQMGHKTGTGAVKKILKLVVKILWKTLVKMAVTMIQIF